MPRQAAWLCQAGRLTSSARRTSTSGASSDAIKKKSAASASSTGGDRRTGVRDGGGCLTVRRDLHAAARRPVPRIRGRRRAVLADGLQPPAPGHSLPRGAGMDGALVQSSRRPVVPSMGVSRPPRGPDGAAGVRPAEDTNSVLSGSLGCTGPADPTDRDETIPRRHRTDVPRARFKRSSRCSR